MTQLGIQLKNQLLSLPFEDRVELAQLLWNSIEEPANNVDDPAWLPELDRRFQEIRTGTVAGEPADQVIAELREKHK